MRYRAEACFTDTEDVAADLGQWESKKAAQLACIGHADEPLNWQEPWSGMWQAWSEAYWYRIVASRS